jgi:Ni,Fe-hydrogenase I large subunit
VIQETVLSWPGVTAHEHKFGGNEYRLGKEELGHVHGDTMADLEFPKKIRDELVKAGRVQPHHVIRDSGWVTRRIRQPEDTDKVIALFRMNYERLNGQRG